VGFLTNVNISGNWKLMLYAGIQNQINNDIRHMIEKQHEEGKLSPRAPMQKVIEKVSEI
jgi:hypothetical protein